MSVRGAVLRKADLEAGIEQADGEHESGLAAAHDGDVTHDASPPCRTRQLHRVAQP